MRRHLAVPAAFALALTILLPTAGAAAKVTCDPAEQVPGWESLAYASIPVGLPEGTHTFSIHYAFTDVDGISYEDTIEGSFDVSADAPLVAGPVWVTPWGMLAPKASDPISEMNPAQPAKFLLGWGTPKYIAELDLNVSRQLETQVFHTMVQTVSLDGGPAKPMHFHQVAEACWWI